MPTPCLGGLESVGIVACAAVSTVSVGVCGIANLKNRLNKKPYDTRDLTIERHKVNKVAQNVRCFKNGQELGTGTAMFDGEMLEMPFLPASINMVAVSGMVVRSDGRLVQLTPKDAPITEFKMEFPEEESAEKWSHYFQDAVNNITLSYHARVAELRNRIKMQERVIRSLHDQAGYGEEAGPIVDSHHRAILHKVQSHRSEMVDHAGKLHAKLAALEEKIHPSRSKYEDHATRLEDKLREFESQIKSRGSEEAVTSLRNENADLAIKVEELRMNKMELVRMADVLNKRLEALEKGAPGSGNSTGLYSKVQTLQAEKNEKMAYARDLEQKLAQLEQGGATTRSLAPVADPAMVSKMQELETRLQTLHVEKQTLVSRHQQQLSAKDQDLAQHLATIGQHTERLQMYQEQTPQLQQQVAQYEQKLVEQSQQMALLEQQAREAQTSPEYDTGAIDAIRAERAAALHRAEVAEAKLMTFEIEFQKAVNEATDHQQRAHQEATNAQAEAEKAQSLHNEKEALMMQLQQAKVIAEEHQARAAKLQEGHSNSAGHVQQLAAFEAQKQQDELAIAQLEAAVQGKDAQYEKMVAEVQESKDQEINELMLTLDAKDQEVGALVGEVQALKEACAVIPQLESDREQLIATINQEREVAQKLEADLKTMEQQAPTVSYEEECLTLQGQLRGSQQELFAAQAKIVELEAKMEQQAAQAAQAVAAASLPLSPVSPPAEMENVSSPIKVSTISESAPLTLLEAPVYTTTVEQLAVPHITTMAETIPTAGILSPQPVSASRYVDTITPLPASPSKITYASPYVTPLSAPPTISNVSVPYGASTAVASTPYTLPRTLPGLTEVDKVDASGRIVERDFYVTGATTTAPSTGYASRSAVTGAPLLVGAASPSTAYSPATASSILGRPVTGIASYSGGLPPYPTSTIRR